MEIKIGICKKCQNKLPIVNKTFCLCQNCNFKRLHPNKSQLEHKSQSQQGFRDRAAISTQNFNNKIRENKLSTNKPLAPFSNKRKKELVDYNKIKQEKIYIKGAKCINCSNESELDPSHVVHRSVNAALFAVKENIVPQCRDCHDIWGSNNVDKIKSLQNLDLLLNIVKKLDISYYKRLMYKLYKKLI